jgi:hypothetical protein
MCLRHLAAAAAPSVKLVGRPQHKDISDVHTGTLHERDDVNAARNYALHFGKITTMLS